MTRPKRLFSKNTSLCEAVRQRIGGDACPLSVGEGDSSAPQGAKRKTEAPIKGGRNYNGPKVAKFLVG